MADPVLLVGDIGGTNARFALADPHRPAYRAAEKFTCADFATAEDAIQAFLEGQGAGRPDHLCLAAAGPVVDGVVRLTNNHWTLSSERLGARFGARSARLLNDFEAIAYALPFLEEADLRPVGPPGPTPDPEGRFNLAVLGPGTGLGMAGLIGRSGAIHAVVGEGGHQGFAPESARQLALLRVLRERFERVSDERLVSGPGLVHLHDALRTLEGRPGAPLEAADIFDRAEAGEDDLAEEAVKLFFEVLGQVAGNLVLALGAFDGVFIAGGIVKRYPRLLAASGFRAGFDNKGRHRSLMERVPVHLITHPDPGLLGAAYGALERGGAVKKGSA